MKERAKCETLRGWLKANLGHGCLAPCTGTDFRALDAAVQIVELYAYSPSKDLQKAFGIVVSKMQSSTRELAFHSIAHCLDWHIRRGFWMDAGLDIEEVRNFRRCKFE